VVFDVSSGDFRESYSAFGVSCPFYRKKVVENVLEFTVPFVCSYISSIMLYLSILLHCVIFFSNGSTALSWALASYFSL
jgi:hypothetical protein